MSIVGKNRARSEVNAQETWKLKKGSFSRGPSLLFQTVLFNYKKTFDLIDHSILVRKLRGLDIPTSIVQGTQREILRRPVKQQ